MSVACDDAPDNLIGPWGEMGEQEYLQQLLVIGIDVTVPVVHPISTRIPDSNRAKGGLQDAIEPDADAAGGNADRRPYPGVGSLKKDVSPDQPRPNSDKREGAKYG